MTTKVDDKVERLRVLERMYESKMLPASARMYKEAADEIAFLRREIERLELRLRIEGGRDKDAEIADLRVNLVAYDEDFRRYKLVLQLMASQGCTYGIGVCGKIDNRDCNCYPCIAHRALKDGEG